MNAIDQLNRLILLCRDHVSAGMTDEQIARRFQSTHVMLVSNAENVASHSGQTAVITLISLLLRMGVQVDLAIPEVELIHDQPPFGKGPLRAVALGMSGQLISATAVRESSGITPDLTVVLGDTPIPLGITGAWRLVGADWRGELISKREQPGWKWAAGWPVGAMVGAALAAGEVFKHVMREFPFRFDADREYFQASSQSAWDFGAIPIPRDGINLGSVDIISAGAISQAVLFVLTRLPGIHMNGRIFDDDVTGISNLNRNMLTLVGDLGSSKAKIASLRCASKFLLEPVVGRFTAHGSEARDLAPLALVGVDHIPSRWQVQECSSGTVVVSGTSHFSVSSSSHRVGEACCGCLHPIDDAAAIGEIPTISFVSFWAGLLMAVRVLRESVGRPYARERQHLWLTPLRMDLAHSAMWSPVFSRTDCPVGCSASRLRKLPRQVNFQYQPDSCA
jgi:hypothetical protein